MSRKFATQPATYGCTAATVCYKLSKKSLLAQYLGWIQVSNPMHGGVCGPFETRVRRDLDPKSVIRSGFITSPQSLSRCRGVGSNTQNTQCRPAIAVAAAPSLESEARLDRSWLKALKPFLHSRRCQAYTHQCHKKELLLKHGRDRRRWP